MVAQLLRMKENEVLHSASSIFSGLVDQLVNTYLSVKPRTILMKEQWLNRQKLLCTVSTTCLCFCLCRLVKVDCLNEIINEDVGTKRTEVTVYCKYKLRVSLVVLLLIVNNELLQFPFTRMLCFQSKMNVLFLNFWIC